MNTLNWKSLSSGIGAGILGLCSIVADAPPELQKQIPQVFPESQRGYLALAFMAAAYIAHRYSAAHAINAAVAAALTPQVPVSFSDAITSKPMAGDPFAGQKPKP